MTKPNVSNSQIITNLTTSWEGADQGFSRTWPTAIIQFSLPTTSPDGANNEENGFQTLTTNEASLARLAFELWDDLIARDITETTGNNAPITFAYSSTTRNDGTYTHAETSSHTSTDRQINHEQVWIDSGWNSNQDANVKFGSYGFMTYIHEIGHSLGLSHPGVYNASDSEAPTYDDDATYSRDTRQYTVMSYFGVGSDGSGAAYSGSNASTPMIDDILAIQAKYGADMTTRTGDTTYGFHSNADRSVFDFTRNTQPVFTIWDAGGKDVIDASLFFGNQRIDLVAGHYSNIGGLFQNVGIAYNVTIEEAFGGFGDDVLIGNDTSNILHGGTGDDSLTGNGGSDTLIGGAGNDTYDVDTAARFIHIGSRIIRIAGDQVIENTGGGTDSVYSSVNYTLTDNVENLYLTGTAVSGTGNSLDNTLTGTDFANILDGGAGNDRLSGFAGADTLIGGTGDDTYYVDTASRFIHIGGRIIHLPGDQVIENADEGTDTVNSSVNHTLADNVENLNLTGTAVSGTGNDLDNAINGNDAANSLDGAAGNDVLDGGAGADTLTGGTGDDTYYVDTASRIVHIGSHIIFRPGDRVIENADEGTDTVYSSVNHTLADNVENLNLTGTAVSGTGNDLDNAINGNDAANSLDGAAGNDVLDGGAGADTLTGGTGDDTYYVDTAPRFLRIGSHFIHIPGDQVIENADEGTDIVYSSVSHTLADNVENLTLQGGDDLSGYGNALDNVLTGNTGANYLDGHGGNDSLYGGDGADTFEFSDALDTSNVDQIGDFSVVDDTIELAFSIFSALSTGSLLSDAFHIGEHADDTDDHIIYDDENGMLIYDDNGNDDGGEVVFATISAHLDLTSQNFMIV